MELFILTCINEDLEIVEQNAFHNFENAQVQMRSEFEREKSALEEGEEDIVLEDIKSNNAELAWGCQPYNYRWFIRSVEY